MSKTEQEAAIVASLARAGEQLAEFRRTIKAAMAGGGDEAQECAALHDQARDALARAAGHAIARVRNS